MKIAIVGANGFVGSHVAQEAMRRGWLVTSVGRNTPLSTIKNADAVVHSVGTFMEDQRYKRLLSSPVTLPSIAKLIGLRLGLAPRNPMAQTVTFADANYKPAVEAAEALRPEVSTAPVKRIPFVYLSATDSPAAERGYIESKRKAERYLANLPYLRAVFLRPGFIGLRQPKGLCTYDNFTPRNILDNTLRAVNSKYVVSADAVAEAVCDAIEDNSIEGVVECEAIRALDQ